MTIQYIKHTTEASNLEEWGPVGIPLGETVCQLRGVMKSIPGREGIDTGVWECSPGRFRRQIKSGEVMHILSGRCTFTPDNAATFEINAGDTLFFAPDTSGIWDIQETLRKVYVLI